MRWASLPSGGSSLLIALQVGLAACSSSDDEPSNGAPDAAPVSFSREALLDPETCKECHPVHYDQWSGSMHAYAADDPLFLAMNARGQEETGGALGPFCVGCHAPVAVAEGLTTDGTDLDTVPKHLKGVTCYFCHNVDRVEDDHNNPLVLANDTTMRGGIGRLADDPPPTENDTHASAYSPLVDGRSTESAKMCGACHDIITPAGVHLERTYAEWRETLYSGGAGLTCADCHAKRDGARSVIADYEGVPGGRRVHGHDFEGVDVALTDFPNRERQRILVERQLATTVALEICVSQLGGISLLIDNAGAGHSFPSGAGQDRRVWPEIVASRIAADGSEEVLYQTGVVGEQEPVAKLDDPDLWLMRDEMFGSDGQEVHMFWEAAAIESSLIPGAVTTDRGSPDYHVEQVSRVFSGSLALTEMPDRVTVLVRVRPMGFDVLEDVAANPGLDAAVVDAMPTIDVIPNRCYPPDMRARHPDLFAESSVQCDPDADVQKYTLVWTREAAAASGRTADIDGQPAQCVADAAVR